MSEQINGSHEEIIRFPVQAEQPASNLEMAEVEYERAYQWLVQTMHEFRKTNGNQPSDWIVDNAILDYRRAKTELDTARSQAEHITEGTTYSEESDDIGYQRAA